MPRVYRLMRKAEDGLPVVEQTAGGLGVRVGVDVDVDSDGLVLANAKGMSVNPHWRAIANVNMVPRRLKDKYYGARGPNGRYFFRCGEGPFERGAFADQLILDPDSETHGVVAPSETMPLADYQAALAATRWNWVEDEA